MDKGIIYIMTTVVPGLIKIGRTGSENFDHRMRNLEHNGYRNVTALKRTFAIEVEDYIAKEEMLHTIFEKSQVGDTELFALDVNIAIQLLSSFEGSVVYPKTETKEDIFEEATENTEKSKSKSIPDGKYFLTKKTADNRTLKVIASIKDGCWTLLKGSVVGIADDGSGSKIRYESREKLSIDENGVLLEDVYLGNCSPSFAASLASNESMNGWTEWKDSKKNKIDIYRK